MVYAQDMLSSVKGQFTVFCSYPITKFLWNSCFPAIRRQIFEYVYIKVCATTIWRRIREFHDVLRKDMSYKGALIIQTQHVHMSYFGPSLRFFPRLALFEMAMGKLLVTLKYERF